GNADRQPGRHDAARPACPRVGAPDRRRGYPPHLEAPDPLWVAPSSDEPPCPQRRAPAADDSRPPRAARYRPGVRRRHPGALGPRSLVVAREITKVHEEFLRGTPATLLEHFAKTPPRGELTVVVAGSDWKAS